MEPIVRKINSIISYPQVHKPPSAQSFLLHFLFGKHHFCKTKPGLSSNPVQPYNLVHNHTKHITHLHFNHTHPTSAIQNGHDRSHHKATGPLYQVLHPESPPNEAAPVPWCPSSSSHSSPPPSPSRSPARRPLRRDRLWLRRRERSPCRPKQPPLTG